MICAGLGRFDSEEYFNRALAFDFDGSAWGEFEQACLDPSFRNTDDLACVQKMRNLTMARDLVQLVFRSTLRNHGGTEPVFSWLIEPPEEVVMHVREICSETANMTRFPNYRSNACPNWQPAEPFKGNRPMPQSCSNGSRIGTVPQS